MADPKGFLTVKRKKTTYRPVCERVQDYREVSVARDDKHSQDQASRCMDCGTPFCHWGCPVGNYIPEWNDYVFKGNWQKAFELLDATNNLPEITGRICPAPCEYACVLGINDEPVTIRENELAIIEYAFKKGFIKAQPPALRTDKKVAIIGSGPAGLAAASQLNRAGHTVVVFERDDKIGGILRYGIPDFKLEKWVLDRRIHLMQQEGVEFRINTHVGSSIAVAHLRKEFDALCLTGGSRHPRDLAIEGRELRGIHFAMDFLTQSNKLVRGENISVGELINAHDKHVVVIGGGDTGSDCVGTAHRQGARCVTQIEVLPQPAECRSEKDPWPKYPLLLKTSTSHEEGGERHWAVLTKKFCGKDGRVAKLHCVRVDFSQADKNNCPLMREIPGSEFDIDTNLVILAVGFLHPEHNQLLKDLGVELDQRGNVKTNAEFMTSVNGVFAAGDAHRGQSLVVWAISEGRRAAYAIDKHLMGDSQLPAF